MKAMKQHFLRWPTWHSPSEERSRELQSSELPDRRTVLATVDSAVAIGLAGCIDTFRDNDSKTGPRIGDEFLSDPNPTDEYPPAFDQMPE